VELVYVSDPYYRSNAETYITKCQISQPLTHPILYTKFGHYWSKSIIEIDQQLYKKYKLSDEEIAFIEENVRPMV